MSNPGVLWSCSGGLPHTLFQHDFPPGKSRHLGWKTKTISADLENVTGVTASEFARPFLRHTPTLHADRMTFHFILIFAMFMNASHFVYTRIYTLTGMVWKSSNTEDIVAVNDFHIVYIQYQLPKTGRSDLSDVWLCTWAIFTWLCFQS